LQSSNNMLFDNLEDKCLIAIPKKGRLYEKILPLLVNIGVHYVRKQRHDIAICSNLKNTALVFLPAQDIAIYTSLGRVDMGITGLDLVEEYETTNDKVNVVARLGFGKCRLVVQVPQNSGIKDVRELVGKRIATSFPHTTSKFFKIIDPNIETTIEKVSGSVEVACALGLAHAVVDLVETGDTMRAAGLKELETIMESEAVFIINPKSKHMDIAEKITKRIKGVLTAENFVMVEYNIERSKLARAKQIHEEKFLTLSPLDNADQTSVRVMVPRQSANQILDSLEEIGATDTVVNVISNCRNVYNNQLGATTVTIKKEPFMRNRLHHLN